MLRVVIPAIIILVLLASCRSTRKIQTAISKKDTAATVITGNAHEDSMALIHNTYNDILKNKVDYKTLSAKINVNYVDADDKNYNVNANLRMYKDSAIWISITAIFGIEGLRVYITNDSVKVLDKQNKVYTGRSVSYLQEVAKLPLTLPVLQDLLVGNPVYLDSNIVSYSKYDDRLSLLSIGSLFRNLLTVSSANKLMERSKLDDVDITRSRTCDLTYSDYENKNGVSFATVRKITIAEKKKLDIRLEFKQYEFNSELTFPFSIPKNYKRN